MRLRVPYFILQIILEFFVFLENVWPHLKRGIYGVYRHVSKKYLQAYTDEFAFRHNNRKEAGQMFRILLDQILQVKIISLKQLVLADQ